MLPASLLKVLHTPGVETPGETYATPWRRARVDDAHYALGWRVYDYAGQTLVFHAGAVRGYRAMIGFLPDRHVGLVMLWNSGNRASGRTVPDVHRPTARTCRRTTGRASRRPRARRH